MEGILVPISFFGMIAAIVLVPRYFKSLERQKMAETLRAAIERGQELPPEMISAMTSDVRPKGLPPSPQRDIRTGVIWLFLAAGLATFGLLVGMEEPDATYPLLAFAAFPGFIGAAFVVLGLLNKSKV